jgi:archaeosortase A (PGF-CTERM-specific)
MVALLEAALSLAARLSAPLAWVVVVGFIFTTVASYRSRALARRVGVLAWLLFALFWLVQTPHFLLVQKSAIEGVGSLVAVPVALYVAWLLYGGRDSLLVLSRAIAVMGLVFLPFETVDPLRGWLVETVTAQTEFLMTVAGTDPRVVSGAEVCATYAADGSCLTHYPDYRSTFVAQTTNPYTGNPYVVTYTILIACTGVGSMAIFAGLVAAVRAPRRRKLAALAVSLPVVYVLNLVRNVFIGLSFGEMRLQFAPELVAGVFGFSLTQDPALVSYYLADRVLAQSGSVLALVAITYLVVRVLPETLMVVEDLLYVVTGTEYDLAGALDADGTSGAGAGAETEGSEAPSD